MYENQTKGFKMSKSAFTMIELVFVIVVLGILAGVAVPKLAVTRDDATAAKLRADVASIRSGIALERSKAMMEGNLTNWRNNFTLADNFSNVLQTGVSTGNDRNGWTKTGNNWQACVASRCATFAFNANAGTFNCTSGDCELFE